MEYDFTELQQAMDDIFAANTIHFEELCKEMLRGDIKTSVMALLEALWKLCVGEIAAGRQAMLMILGIGIMAAVFYNISLAFESRQIADTSFFVTYLAFLSISVLSFTECCKIAEKLLEHLELFMKALIPAFFLAVSMSSGSTAAIGFYKVVLILLSLADGLLLKLILPMIKLSTILMLVNYIMKETVITKLAKLFQTVISWSLKGVLTIAIAMNTVQGMVLPSVDKMKLSMLHKAVSVLPGIGNSADAVTSLMEQSGQMIKNGIGTAAFFVLGMIAAIPVIKIGLLILMYELTCAMLQPVSDKRMVEALSAICEGGKHLMQLVVTAGILYMVTIAIVCVTT